MQTFNIHEAKTHLSRLIDNAVKGEPFIIAKAGKPLVTVMRIEASESRTSKRIGFMTGRIAVPSDFDSLGHKDITKLFGIEE
jgi:prevent-host-death family protein